MGNRNYKLKSSSQQEKQNNNIRLLKKRKLSLIFDLDETILQTCQHKEKIIHPDIHYFKLDKREEWFHLKLRPYLKEFLKHISRYYELHVCTMASRSYAKNVLEIVDPNKKYFKHQIVTRNELITTRSKFMNLMLMFPEGTETLVILDDLPHVWKNMPNVISAKPYRFFPKNFKRFIFFDKKSGGKIFELQDLDNYLKIIEKTFITIHEKYFSQIEKNLNNESYEDMIKYKTLLKTSEIMKDMPKYY